jgi:phytoene desaturase
MNYAEIALGTWTMGRMHEVIKGMVSLAEERELKFCLDIQLKR